MFHKHTIKFTLDKPCNNAEDAATYLASFLSHEEQIILLSTTANSFANGDLFNLYRTLTDGVNYEVERLFTSEEGCLLWEQEGITPILSSITLPCEVTHADVEDPIAYLESRPGQPPVNALLK